MKNAFYPPGLAGSSGTATVNANQGLPNTDANAWPVKVTDGTDELLVNADGSINVAITGGLANPLPVQDSAAEASLASIDAKLTNPLPVTDTPLKTSVDAFSAKTAAGLVPEKFDEQVITYVGATSRINTVTYKLATVTVATLTMSYDGSDRLTGVVKS